MIRTSNARAFIVEMVAADNPTFQYYWKVVADSRGAWTGLVTRPRQWYDANPRYRDEYGCYYHGLNVVEDAIREMQGGTP